MASKRMQRIGARDVLEPAMSKRTEKQRFTWAPGRGCCGRRACGGSHRSGFPELLQDDVSTTADVLAGVDTEEQTNANQNEGSVQRGMQEEEQEVNIDNFMYNRTGTNTMEKGSPAIKTDGEGSDSRGGRAVGKEMWDEEMEERRLCFGCDVQRVRAAFSTLRTMRMQSMVQIEKGAASQLE